MLTDPPKIVALSKTMPLKLDVVKATLEKVTVGEVKVPLARKIPMFPPVDPLTSDTVTFAATERVSDDDVKVVSERKNSAAKDPVTAIGPVTLMSRSDIVPLRQNAQADPFPVEITVEPVANTVTLLLVGLTIPPVLKLDSNEHSPEVALNVTDWKVIVH